MLTRLELPHLYEVEVLVDLPLAGQPPLRHFPGETQSGRDGLLLRIHPEAGEPWIGCFAFGYESKDGLTGVLSSPEPHTLFVLARGAGYSVRTDAPNNWEKLPVLPVLSAEVEPGQKLVVLGSYTALAVYRPEGRAWFRTVVPDGLKLGPIGNGQIAYSGWDPAEGKTVNLHADIDTGNETA